MTQCGYTIQPLLDPDLLCLFRSTKWNIEYIVYVKPDVNMYVICVFYYLSPSTKCAKIMHGFLDQMLTRFILKTKYCLSNCLSLVFPSFLLGFQGNRHFLVFVCVIFFAFCPWQLFYIIHSPVTECLKLTRHIVLLNRGCSTPQVVFGAL